MGEGNRVVTANVEAGVAVPVCACGCGLPRRGRSIYHSRRCMNRTYNRRRPVMRVGSPTVEPPPRKQRKPRRCDTGSIVSKILKFLSLNPGLWYPASTLHGITGSTCVSTHVSTVRRWTDFTQHEFRIESMKTREGFWRYRAVRRGDVTTEGV